MPITTKTGDSGITSLLYGGRVRKDNLRVEICGILDELNSFLGLARSLLKNRTLKELIKGVQRELFIVGSEIAAGTSFYKLRNRICQKDVKRLESIIGRLEKKRRLKKCAFVTPGGNTISATLDIARAITRRAERRIVTLRNKEMVKNRCILLYLNRLSDLLYLIARDIAKKSGK